MPLDMTTLHIMDFRHTMENEFYVYFMLADHIPLKEQVLVRIHSQSNTGLQLHKAPTTLQDKGRWRALIRQNANDIKVASCKLYR